jgi:transcriptional regulator of acetoin/glycerol metabolism
VKTERAETMSLLKKEEHAASSGVLPSSKQPSATATAMASKHHSLMPQAKKSSAASNKESTVSRTSMQTSATVDEDAVSMMAIKSKNHSTAASESGSLASKSSVRAVYGEEDAATTKSVSKLSQLSRSESTASKPSFIEISTDEAPTPRPLPAKIKTIVASKSDSILSKVSLRGSPSLSRPGRPERAKEKEKSMQIDKQLKAAAASKKKVEENTLNVILLGTADCGKSTLLRQLTIMYGGGFTEKERDDNKRYIFKILKANFLRLYEALAVKGLDAQLHIDDLKAIVNNSRTMFWV